MTARILDGKALSAKLRAGLAARIAELPFRPGLRVVRVGEDPASGVYVRHKDRAALEAGLDSATLHLPESTTEAALLAEIARLNDDAAVDGILVQLPCPLISGQRRQLPQWTLPRMWMGSTPSMPGGSRPVSRGWCPAPQGA